MVESRKSVDVLCLISGHPDVVHMQIWTVREWSGRVQTIQEYHTGFNFARIMAAEEERRKDDFRNFLDCLAGESEIRS
jgi:hypothetical protein